MLMLMAISFPARVKSQRDSAASCCLVVRHRSAREKLSSGL
jgi:transposase